MISRQTTIIAGLTLTVLTFAAADAAHAAHGVQATASANTNVTVSNGSGWLPNENQAAAAIGPETFDNGFIIATAASSTEIDAGLITASASAASAVRDSRSIPNNTPSGYTEAIYQDRFKVESATLPVGTPVQLVFRNDILVARTSFSGNYDGQIYAQLSVGPANVSNTWLYRFDAGAPAVGAQTITLNTKVGNLLVVDQRFRVTSRAIYRIGTPTGPRFGASAELDASARLTLAGAPEGVSITAESGAQFPLVTP